MSFYKKRLFDMTLFERQVSLTFLSAQMVNNRGVLAKTAIKQQILSNNSRRWFAAMYRLPHSTSIQFIDFEMTTDMAEIMHTYIKTYFS